LGVAERGLGVEQALPDVQRHAGVGAKAVPISVVVLELHLLGNLPSLRLQLLQAHHVRAVALHPLAQLHLARADAVDVPGGDFHFRSMPSYFTTRNLCEAAARSRRSFFSRALRVSEAARSNSARASSRRPSFTRRSPRTAGI